MREVCTRMRSRLRRQAMLFVITLVLLLLLLTTCLVYLLHRLRQLIKQLNQTTPPTITQTTLPVSTQTTPSIPVPINSNPTRRIAYLWLLCFHLDDCRQAINDFDPTLIGKLTSEDAQAQQENKPLLLSAYALGISLGTEEADLKTPYKTFLNSLKRFFHDQGLIDLPKGIYGWRHFFIERGWDQEPPAWLQEHIV